MNAVQRWLRAVNSKMTAHSFRRIRATARQLGAPELLESAILRVGGIPFKLCLKLTPEEEKRMLDDANVMLDILKGMQ